MANISGQNTRREGHTPLQAYFGSRWKPFWRPVDLTKKAHHGVEKDLNIDIFRRPLSLCWAFLPQTSNAIFMSLRPRVSCAKVGTDFALEAMR